MEKFKWMLFICISVWIISCTSKSIRSESMVRSQLRATLSNAEMKEMLKLGNDLKNLGIEKIKIKGTYR